MTTTDNNKIEFVDICNKTGQVFLVKNLNDKNYFSRDGVRLCLFRGSVLVDIIIITRPSPLLFAKAHYLILKPYFRNIVIKKKFPRFTAMPY